MPNWCLEWLNSCRTFSAMGAEAISRWIRRKPRDSNVLSIPSSICQSASVKALEGFEENANFLPLTTDFTSAQVVVTTYKKTSWLESQAYDQRTHLMNRMSTANTSVAQLPGPLCRRSDGEDLCTRGSLASLCPAPKPRDMSQSHNPGSTEVQASALKWSNSLSCLAYHLHHFSTQPSLIIS